MERMDRWPALKVLTAISYIGLEQSSSDLSHPAPITPAVKSHVNLAR